MFIHFILLLVQKGVDMIVEITVCFIILLAVLATLLYGNLKGIDGLQAIAGMAGVPVIILLDVYIFVEARDILKDRFEQLDNLMLFFFTTDLLIFPYIFLIVYLGEKNKARHK